MANADCRRWWRMNKSKVGSRAHTANTSRDALYCRLKSKYREGLGACIEWLTCTLQEHNLHKLLSHPINNQSAVVVPGTGMYNQLPSDFWLKFYIDRTLHKFSKLHQSWFLFSNGLAAFVISIIGISLDIKQVSSVTILIWSHVNLKNTFQN